MREIHVSAMTIGLQSANLWDGISVGIEKALPYALGIDTCTHNTHMLCTTCTYEHVMSAV